MTHKKSSKSARQGRCNKRICKLRGGKSNVVNARQTFRNAVCTDSLTGAKRNLQGLGLNLSDTDKAVLAQLKDLRDNFMATDVDGTKYKFCDKYVPENGRYFIQERADVMKKYTLGFDLLVDHVLAIFNQFPDRNPNYATARRNVIKELQPGFERYVLENKDNANASLWVYLRSTEIPYQIKNDSNRVEKSLAYQQRLRPILESFEPKPVHLLKEFNNPSVVY